MTDITEWLRKASWNCHLLRSDGERMREAADTIERLETKLSNALAMAESYGKALEAMGQEVERLREVVRSMGGTP